MKVSTRYKVEAGLVRLTEQESVPLQEFREKMAGTGTISQPDWGWIEVTVEVDAGDISLTQRPPRLEFK